MKHDERRQALTRFTKGLEELVKADDRLTGCIAIVFTAEGRTMAYMTPSLEEAPVVVVAEIRRTMNAIRIGHQITDRDLDAMLVGIARLEDGALEGRA